MRRSLEDTFTLVQELNLYLCYHPKYSKLPFSERDKIVAGCEDLQITSIRASQARRAVNEFCKFKNVADLCISHAELKPANLEIIVQSFFATLKTDKNYSGCEAPKLDDIIAKALGYARDTIKHYKVACGHYKRFRWLVQAGAREAKYRPAKKTYARVKLTYLNLWKNSQFRTLPKLMRDEIVAKEVGLKPATIIAIRKAQGTYKKFGGF